ncbi:MAG: PSD1 and planctomycete cytochrome C domain-containing protein [Gemmatimonadota bacterium]|nr:PSD1 and planctomycete cytochrome C domain-containing protein [Gemmatimonadota bacterium]
MKLSFALAAFAAGIALAFLAPHAGAQSSDEFFETRVRPVLAEKCAECHSEQRRRGGLRVTSLEDLLRGGRSGPAIVPGDPDGSLLIQVVRHEIEDLEMPQDAAALTGREIEGLAEWIRMDAPWPEAASAVSFASTPESAGLSPGAQIFVDRVRPVLEQKCFSCHTDDERGGLRLDSRERVLQGGGRGPAIIPGNPEQSVLIAALRHTSDDLQMPRNAGPLSEQEIEGFVQWILAGAEWADVSAPLAIPRRAITAEERSHWSFRPLARPSVPTPTNDAWAKTDIDRFVLAALQRQGLAPVGPADKRTLIRRATYDLIGLPPTPEEIDAFLNDESPDAFERVVDRLLDSEHYGERWGRHWLDVTRFGEDDTRGLAPGGSGRERYPMAYVHRDWVVEAFNEDMAYDTFLMAHLAADLMPEEKREDLLPGLGFLGQGPWYYDIADPVIARADERHDRVDVTTRGFMGLTVGCARCHDHKYDPIGTHDYYAIAGIFDNANYYEYPVADSAAAAEYKKEQEFIKTMKEGLAEYLSTEAEQLARVLSLQTSDYMMAAWQVTGKEQLPVETAASRARLDLEVLQRWIRFLGKEPKHYPYVVPWQEMIADEGGTEERARELADDFQRMVLEFVAEKQKLEERNRKIIARGTPLEETKSTPMPNGFESFFDQHQLELDTMDREKLNLLTDLFGLDLDNELDTFFPQPGVFRFSGWGLERQLSRIADDHVAAMREEIEELEEALPDIPFVMGVEEKEEAAIADIGLHVRGDPRTLAERVPRGFPHVLQDETPDRYTEGSGRLRLARDIAEHPITSRVIVNRVWGWHMGAGIVRTPSNFGFAGSPPTNPELLEFLASDFVANGHSIKRLHKEIMLSSVYQLAADDNPTFAGVDPENRYFWRFNRQRLTAEAIRDGLLAVSGELDDEVGGESLQLDDEDNRRRTLYAEVSRFQLHEYLQTFDFPNPSLSAERRYATNVPLQSLYFMNSDFVHRQADAFVRRLAKVTDERGSAEGSDQGDDGAADEGRAETTDRSGVKKGEEEDPDPPEHFDDRAMLEAAYPLLYGREVTPEEAELGLEFLETQRAAHLDDELKKLVAEEDAEGDAASGPPGTDGGSGSGASGRNAHSSADDPGRAEGDGGSVTSQAENDRAMAERRASLKAWVQYARALFSAAEFRFIS